MRRRRSPDELQLDVVAITLREGRKHVAVLERLLEEERARSADLLNRLLIAQAAGPAVQTGPIRPAFKPDAQWNWPDIQPEDEAREDVLAQVESGALDRAEAEAILEHLGFGSAEVLDIDL